MFFLIGLFLGALYGAAAQVALGVPLLFGRGLGLLWGDRRIWWTLALLFAVVVGRYYVSASNRHGDFTDQLQRGFVLYQNAGVIFGAAFIWLIGMLVLWKVGTGWKAPITGLAPSVSVVALLALAVSAFLIQKHPDSIRDQRAEDQAAWAAAIQQGDLNAIQSFVTSGKALWSHSQDLPNGPLDYAVYHHEASLVLDLIQLNPRQDDARISVVTTAALNDKRSVLSAVFKDVPEKQPELVAQALWLTIGKGDYSLYNWLFDEFAADPNMLPEKGNSLLMAAARTGRIDFAENLILRGADVEYLHPGGRHQAENALGTAIHFGQTEMVKFLLDQGADPNGRREGSYTPLMRAIDQRKPDSVPLLLGAGADPDLANHEGSTALHIASRGSRPDLKSARFLIDAGGDPKLANHQGFQPITRLPDEWFD
ncbi:MAG: ankyrin repeat domain-containing protein [Verrucomicrobiota bacterium]